MKELYELYKLFEKEVGTDFYFSLRLDSPGLIVTLSQKDIFFSKILNYGEMEKFVDLPRLIHDTIEFMKNIIQEKIKNEVRLD